MHSIKTIVGPMAASTALAFSVSVNAETSPYFIGVNQAFTYDTNVFNLSGGQPQPPEVVGRSDAISSTSLVGGIDQPFGRQRFYATGNVAYNKYKTNSQLDNTSYGVDAGLDWATIERLTGTVRLSANQGLGSFALTNDTPVQDYEKNTQNTEQAVLTARWGATPRVGIEGGYIYRNVSLSNPSTQSNEYSQNTFSLGATYGETGILELGAAVRFSKTDYPKFRRFVQQPPPAKPLLVIGDEADGKNLDFTAKWVPNGLSTVDARVSLTDVSHTNDPSNDFSGVTGSLAWGYRPTGKLYTRLTVLAAPGSGVTFVDFSGASTPFINNAKSSTALRMLATYQATGKIELNGFIGFENNKYADDSTTGRAVTSRIQFGAKYAATQNINMNCYFQYQARDSDTLLANSYWGNTVYCGAELLLR